jgi:RNA polymerase sigma factor (sigma-70 family)
LVNEILWRIPDAGDVILLNMTDTDLELLARYTRHHAEDAFAEIVRRYLDLVHSAALRQVRSAQLAEEVAQSTFVNLARNANRLAPGTILPAWLYQVTRREAIDVVRREARRQLREQTATEMNAINATAADWTDIGPLLDEAMDALEETDRAALLLRYFENKSLREVGQTLGTSENAAQKRLSRAVDRLRQFFAKRGVSVGAGGLTVILSANAVQAAPAGLGLAISNAASLAGPAIAGVTASAAAKTFAMTTLQKTLIAATVAAALGFGIYEAGQASRLRVQVNALRQEREPKPGNSGDNRLEALREERDLLAARNGDLSKALDQANAEKARLEGEREQARHSAALFKELAAQARSSEENSTNAYPTARHVLAGWGKLGRLSVMLDEDGSKLSAEEKSAARINALGQITELMKAMKHFGMDEDPGDDNPADYVACVLYGALDLDEQQFGQLYGLLEKYQQQAKKEDLFRENAGPEVAAASKQMVDQVIADFQEFLTPDQAKILQAIAPHIQLLSRKIDFNFKFGEN